MRLSSLTKHLLFIIYLLIVSFSLNAQLMNNGGIVTISDGGQLKCNKGITNITGTINNDGILSLGGNVENQGNINNAIGSNVLFNGTASQNISGSALNVFNLEINNSSGITLNTDLAVYGAATFNSGNINTLNKMMVFAYGSTIANTPGDSSHVIGKIKFEGLGDFTFPVGNNIKYQPITVNLSTNHGGLVASYYSADAGNTVFSTSGSVSTPIVSYNKKEYWRLNQLVDGAGKVKGNVTLYWDGYNDAYTNSLAQRTVARKINNAWLNEGGVATGSITEGKLVSNKLRSWGIFTLGSINSLLGEKIFFASSQLKTNQQTELNRRFVRSQ